MVFSHKLQGSEESSPACLESFTHDLHTRRSSRVTYSMLTRPWVYFVPARIYYMYLSMIAKTYGLQFLICFEIASLGKVLKELDLHVGFHFNVIDFFAVSSLSSALFSFVFFW